MTRITFYKICEGYGLTIKKDIFYQALYGNYCVCDYSTSGQAYLYTDKGVVGTKDEKKLKSYLEKKILWLKQRKFDRKLARLEDDFE